MRRRLVLLLLLLVGGAIVNVAVAWAATYLWTGEIVWRDLAHWEVDGRKYCGLLYEDAAFCTVWGEQEHLTVKEGATEIARTDLPSWSFATEDWQWGSPKPSWFSVRDDAFGWPLVSLRCRFVGSSTQRRVFEISNEGIAIAPVMLGKTSLARALPLRPIWPGFVINTVFYAFILWGLFAAPFALRRRRRIKRGLCPKCAYPVGTNAVCTECGAAVVKQKAETQKAEIA